MYHRLGKRGRFREFGMWFLDGEEYYNPPGARYLTYQHDVRRAVQRVAEERFGGAMPILYKHMVAMSYQLAVFRCGGQRTRTVMCALAGGGRVGGHAAEAATVASPCSLPTSTGRACRRDALATARMLNRILVLPKSWCYCDYDWTPHVLEKCKIRGSDLRLPFECPADFVFHIPLMELKNMSFRMPGFLESPQVGDMGSKAGADWQPDAPLSVHFPASFVFV